MRLWRFPRVVVLPVPCRDPGVGGGSHRKAQAAQPQPQKTGSPAQTTSAYEETKKEGSRALLDFYEDASGNNNKSDHGGMNAEKVITRPPQAVHAPMYPSVHDDN